MKLFPSKFLLLAILIASCIPASLAGGYQDIDEEYPTVDDQIYEVISNMEIPLVEITTVNGEEPTCEVITHPEGAWGSGITNATKVEASMKISKNGELIYDSGEYVKKESGLTIKIRGNTSATKAKKPYKLKLQKKADLLNRGDKKYKDKDWVLLRTGNSLITPIGFWTSELIGQEWTPAHEFVNVVINGTYRGMYVLCEQVTVNTDCRINVDEEEGYVVESDAYWWTEDISFDSNLTVPQMKFTYKYPDPEDITPEWHEKIITDVHANEAKISDHTYDEIYDCESFAKWLVAWELLGNNDGAGGNIYLVKKDAGSKVCMGPLWDFDNALKLTEGWIPIHTSLFYFQHLFKSQNDTFSKVFANLWLEEGHKVADALIARINEFADSPIGLDYQRSLDMETLKNIPSDSWQPYIGDLEFMRDYATNFIKNRATTLDDLVEKNFAFLKVSEITTPDDDDFAYDILGRRIDKSTPGIQIRKKGKVFVKP